MKPYLIVAPHYAYQCGGIKTLHRLCHLLNSKGQEAYITGTNSPENFNVKSFNNLNLDQQKDLQKNGVVVYPEIIAGNPLNFRYVARLDLAPPCHSYHSNELVFMQEDTLRDCSTAKDILTVTYVEDFFKLPEVDNRTKKCFWVGKGGENSYPDITSDCIEITPSWPFPRTELAKLFQESQVFYTYDNLTALTIEARLCGCPIIVLKNIVLSKENFLKNPFSTHAIGFIEDNPNIDKLKLEIPLMLENYEQFKIKLDKQLTNFINKTQSLTNEFNPDYRGHNEGWVDWIPVNKFQI